MILPKKVFRIINYQPRNFHTSPLFKENSILKFQDKICLENILFVNKSLNNLSPSVCNTWFSFSSDQHNYKTSSSTQGNLIKLFYKTERYGTCSITVSAVELWNKIQKQLKDMLLKDLSPNEIKTIVSDFYLSHTHKLDFSLLHYFLSSDSEEWHIKSVITNSVITILQNF